MGLFRRTPPVPVATQAELDALRRQVVELTEKLAEVATAGDAGRQRLDEVDGKLISVNARITQVGTEVTNQLGELSDDIERAHKEQVKLAAEQARYEIQFRQDLAELADRALKKR